MVQNQRTEEKSNFQHNFRSRVITVAQRQTHMNYKWEGSFRAGTSRAITSISSCSPDETWIKHGEHPHRHHKHGPNIGIKQKHRHVPGHRLKACLKIKYQCSGIHVVFVLGRKNKIVTATVNSKMGTVLTACSTPSWTQAPVKKNINS